ncbi:MAG TPA: DegT/DnrJ/EryC1/StrS family aminotransferase, partial [Flavobacteriales bacterium]|nr:DegT/DnrJ/EryC1/StrS family aminotransferase [Flavobacteriales bacterium]
MDRIPLADPRASYLAHRAEIDDAWSEVLNGPTYILGDVVQRFEREFAQFIGVAHGVGVNNGTDAIHLALRALGIGPGDEVITASHTAVATVAAIRMCGAEPVLADVRSDTYTISPDRVRELISDRTKAVIAIHLYGHPADLGALQVICQEFSLKLIEDCAQAHAAQLNGRRLGSWGDVSTFSFYPTKNLGAIGDAGMVLVDDPDLAARVRALRQ